MSPIAEELAPTCPTTVATPAPYVLRMASRERSRLCGLELTLIVPSYLTNQFSASLHEHVSFRKPISRDRVVAETSIGSVLTLDPVREDSCSSIVPRICTGRNPCLSLIEGVGLLMRIP